MKNVLRAALFNLPFTLNEERYTMNELICCNVGGISIEFAMLRMMLGCINDRE
jgi:hypothetical protein